METTELYDAFSDDYDRFVDWDERLAYEMPFIRKQLDAIQARRVLDLACGTGQHAIALARGGMTITGMDSSAAMLARARANAQEANVNVTWRVAGFGQVDAALGEQGPARLDAAICLGNSIPHILTQADLDGALRDLARVVRPGGRLLIQQRNFDKVLAEGQRFMPPQSHRDGEREWLFMRFYDYETDGNLTFNVVRMSRREGDAWRCVLGRTWLHPWLKQDLVGALDGAGFDVTTYGNLAGVAYDTLSSSDLVLVAARR